MSEPFELVDDEELALYLLIYEELQRQFKRITADPALVLSDAFWREMVELMSVAVLPTLVSYGMNGASLALASMADIPDNLFEQVRISVQQHGGDMITNITETTRNLVIDLLDQSILENWSQDELTEALLNMPGSPFGEVRARLIAVTETTTAYIDGAGIAAEELRNQGYLVQIIWQTVRDEIVCQICAPRQGQPQGSGWSELRAAHPGCRCFVTIEATKIVEEA